MWNRLANLALLLVSLSAAMLLAELGLRACGYENQLQYVHYLGREKVAWPLPGVRYLYRAHASFSQSWPSNPRGYFDPESNGIAYRVNNFGFRGEDFSLSRNEKIRIAFLGDSFCWGNGVREEDLFASRIERQMNDQAVLGGQYEIYNFCLAGYNTEHEAALYDQVVRYFQPDILIVWYFLNDINVPPDDLFFRWQLLDGGSWLKPWRQRSRLLDLAVAPINRIRNHRHLVEGVHNAYTEGHKGRASVARGLEKLNRAAHNDGVPTFLAIFPWLYSLHNRTYPFHEAHRVAQSMAEAEGFEVLDLFPFFEGQSAEELWVYPADQHPNEIAHEIAARAALDFLVPRLESKGTELLQASERRRRAHSLLRDESALEEWYDLFAALNEGGGGISESLR